MSNAQEVLQQLVAMSRRLGQPERDLVILIEGNTSALCDDGTFWVKGSGTQLATIDEGGFVRCRLEPLLEMADRDRVSDSKRDDHAHGHASGIPNLECLRSLPAGGGQAGALSGARYGTER